MAKTSYWADDFVEKQRTAKEAVKMIRPGQRVFIGSSCGEPQYLVKTLAEASSVFTDLEIVRLLSLERTPLGLIADKTKSRSINIRSFYLGSGKARGLAMNKRFITPVNLSAIPRLFKSRQLPIHAALIQVTPPDDFGWMSLGVSVDVTLSAAFSADLVIAQVNPRMPRVLGQSFIHVDDVDVIVEHEEELLATEPLPETEAANTIGRLIARLVDDGSTIQIGLGATSKATLLALADKNDLGVHSQYLTQDMMHLFSRGVITNRRKGFNEGKMVASAAIGGEVLYEFLHDNPSVDFRPSDYVNDPTIIARHHRMVSMNVALAMDLTGQVAADALPRTYFTGVTGINDFIRGAALAEGGKSILMFASTSGSGEDQTSRVVPSLGDTAVVVPRGDVHYVVTEYGAVNLFGKSLQERALAMISIAHPEYREELFFEAKEMGLLSEDRTLSDSIHGVYPVKLEEVREINGETVVIRPAKPVDERRIQEHFYNLEPDDVVSRFFHEKHSFVRDDLEEMLEVDYVKDLTIVAVVGEFGFGKVIAMGEYLLNEASNMAEVAFTVNKAYQGRGLGKLLMRKLAEAARENGLAGLFAYTAPHNRGMINLFKTLPYKIKTVFEDDMVLLSCRFDTMET
ncbi:bifunctional acetyl-CoA hydrolase/transferase family protein/GNAT family N-acetyltransferase [Desulfococcus multivorans]|uniref:Acetyl-CoA hydrolase/transferase C-terminal domain containing protein n=1 Tax=Desulfococcus multivorans DSM 2059 TaxID=1121405 RepID=S7TF73_DESML|nr:bifunctional acetyl-CoA hydrolase/transferase family protein/GNAT family N-acetyltransferase [Desulfococcus multivorans]AOY59852.1 acetyl-CoA hydrolase/transferase family protein [Desulfococcus multivorans]AQV02015.1 acetyl-CoA hydrolase [Desulfococcus multivorans]EPR35852.1 Acetyl-CoA hydrolase/transferase C-terminal domain containing protein [Desulfococcus multivorans DSM 2059]SJZ34136.1 Acyl-CoA hydrolase [Desulfococcus multivorans DSM 2059]